jgi:hypothetical protein
MKARRATWALLVVAAFAAPIPALADPIAVLTLRSEPGDFVGQGHTVRLVYQSPVDVISAYISNSLPDGSPGALSFTLFRRTPDFQFAALTFDTGQLGIPFQAGTYSDAERAFATPGHPGLDVVFQGRGSNTLTGSFTVSEVSFARDSFGALQIGRLRTQFEQHSEGKMPALFGEFAYDASPVPEPGTFLLLGSGALGLFMRYRYRLASGRL